jgi:hypothetical protein
MDKSDIVAFLEQKRRGIYNVVVNEYWDSVLSNSPVNLALTIISNDLEKATGKKVSLKYVSLAQAVSKARTNQGTTNSFASNNISGGILTAQGNSSTGKKYEFKDSHEIKEVRKPGNFDID